MKNILISGGNGFIGSYLVKRLESKYKITVIDNNSSIGGIIYVSPNVRFIKGDIRDKNIYKKLSKIKFDTVYHLAAQSAGESSYDNPEYDILTNSYGTYLLTKFCVNNNVRKIIYTSTVAVYGNQSGLIRETSSIEPDSIYGASKFTGELFLKQLTKNSKTKYTIFRVFNVYGPGENLNYLKKGMVSIYLSYVWKRKPIIVKGSINRYRDLTYISDTIDALTMTLNNKKTDNQVYNLSSGKKTEVRILLQSIIDIFQLPKNYPIQIKDSTPGDSFGYHASNIKIRKDLGWKSTIDLNTGLNQYKKWIKKLPVRKNLGLFHPFYLESKNKK